MYPIGRTNVYVCHGYLDVARIKIFIYFIASVQYSRLLLRIKIFVMVSSLLRVDDMAYGIR